MSETKKYEISCHFSSLENLQTEKTLTYCVLEKGDDAIIALNVATPTNNYTESCLLPGTGFAYAKNIATLLCENCFDISTWKYVLDDIEVEYIVTESNMTQKN